MKFTLNSENVVRCLALIGGKWKPAILAAIYQDANRFGAMRKAIPSITKQMLTQQLRELERDGLIDREIFPEIPPRVEYTLTKYGKTALPVVQAMQDWGEADLAKPDASAKDRDQFMLPL